MLEEPPAGGTRVPKPSQTAACFVPPLGLSQYFSSGHQDDTSAMAMAVPDSQADYLRPRWCELSALQGESWEREGKSGDQVRIRAPEVAWLP